VQEKHSKAVSRKTEKPENTVGIDIGDKFSRYCVLNRDGEVIEEARIKTEAGTAAVDSSAHSSLSNPNMASQAGYAECE
jgi:hypothetical protein